MGPAIRSILLILLIASAAIAQTKSPKEIAREISKAVVVVEALDERGTVTGQGSGFIVSETGAVITNLHVVAGASAAQIKLKTGAVYKTADVIAEDAGKDLIVLKINGGKMPRVTLGDSDKTEVGENIVVISSPEGLENSLSTGVISGVRRIENHRVFQITSPISQGSSGGALFNSSGEVIGVVSSYFKSGQNINFAIPINYARGMIGDQATTSLMKIPPIQTINETAAAPTSRGNPFGAPEAVDPLGGPLGERIPGSSNGKLGRSQQEPMFLRPDEAMSFFYRLVENMGRYTTAEVDEMTRTAAVFKGNETAASEQYSIKFLSFYTGLSMEFSKPERMLTGVELLVNWSVDDLKNTFGDKFKRRTLNGQKVLEFGKPAPGKQVIAFLDGNGNVRSVRFTKIKP
jgi:S1-C subfamily serine protease